MQSRTTLTFLALAASTAALTGCDMIERVFRTGMGVTALIIGIVFFVGYVLFRKPSPPTEHISRF